MLTGRYNLIHSWQSLGLALTIFGCATPAQKEVNPFQPKSFSEMRTFLLNRAPDLNAFRQQGPFQSQLRKNYDIRLSTNERINSDLFLSAHSEKAPLVILLHGNGSWKEAHSYQAMHLASWGMHALVLQLPNSGQWLNNGKTLAKVVNFIYRWPEIVDGRIDVNKIILVGHSFGGSAVSIALGDGAPAAGGILLDPAIVSKEVAKFLKQINTPVMLLGADEKVFLARHRGQFFKHIRHDIAELSIKDATHEDAQFPSELSLKLFGFDPFTSEDLQVTFAAAITASAFSLGANGKLDFAWSTFGPDFKSGNFFKARKK